MIIMLEWQL